MMKSDEIIYENNDISIAFHSEFDFITDFFWPIHMVVLD